MEGNNTPFQECPRVGHIRGPPIFTSNPSKSAFNPRARRVQLAGFFSNVILANSELTALTAYK